MKKILFILVFLPYVLLGQNDLTYRNQYCIVTEKGTDSLILNEFFAAARVETGQNIARLNKLNEVAASALAVSIPELPASGLVEKDKLYKYGEQVIQCIQTHNRTIYTPEQTPALFSFYREETAGLIWITNEKVNVGDKRTYNSIEYECIQAHMTQDTWNPELTLSMLWKKIVTTSEWSAGVAYKVNDIVTYQGSTYKCLQAHTSISTWYPSAVPALWQKQ
jgi:hypothetical protein